MKPRNRTWITPPAVWEKLKPNARRMRTEPTAAEDRLWQRLRKNQLGGLRFRRQHPLGPFIVDFFCTSAKVIIEIDGGIHEFQADADRIRQSELEKLGYSFVRFPNEKVLNDLDRVVGEILTTCADRLKTLDKPKKRLSGSC